MENSTAKSREDTTSGYTGGVEILCTLIQFYVYAIYARVLLSWVRTSSEGVIGQIGSVVDKITDPVMAPLRRVLPPVRMGTMALDLSPIVVIIGANVLLGRIC